MNPLHIQATANTPLVAFHPEKQMLVLEGKMIPENVELFYAPILSWVDGYLSANPSLNVVFRLYYYNTSAFRSLFNLCKKLQEYAQQGKQITARWEYEEGDDDSKNDAEELLGSAGFPLEVVAVSE